MKSFRNAQTILMMALVLLMLLNLFLAIHRGPVSAQTVDFDAYLGASISNSNIDGTVGTEWDDAGHYSAVAIDPLMPPYGSAEIWTKHDGRYLYVALRFTADSNNPWVTIMLSPFADPINFCVGYDCDVFGDDNLDPDGYVDAYFQSIQVVHPDTYVGGIQNGVGEMMVGEENLVTLELKKPLNSGDWMGSDIDWSVDSLHELVISWDTDGVGNIIQQGSPPGGSDGGSANHKSKIPPTIRSIYINPNSKSGILFPTVTINPSIIPSGNTSTITVEVKEAGTPISEANVTLSSDLGGNFSSVFGITDSNGIFVSNFTAPYVAEQTSVKITATASKSGYTDRSAQEYLTILYGKSPFYLTVAANPRTVKSGENSTLTVKVKDPFNNPVSDATVTLLSDKRGNFSRESGYTDSNGTFTSTFTAPIVQRNTTITITANATKENYYGNLNQTELTVQPPVDKNEVIDWRWITLSVALASAAVIAASILVVRRGRRDKVYERMRKQYEKAARGS